MGSWLRWQLDSHLNNYPAYSSLTAATITATVLEKIAPTPQAVVAGSASATVVFEEKATERKEVQFFGLTGLYLSGGQQMTADDQTAGERGYCSLAHCSCGFRLVS